MRRFATAFIILAFVYAAFSPRPAVYSQQPDRARRRFVEGEMLVKLKQGVPPGDGLDQVAPLAPPGRFSRFERIETSGGELFLFKFDPRLSVQDAIRNTLSDPRVEYAEPNYLLRPAETVPNDEFFNLMWGLANDGNAGAAGADIGATRVWDITQGSQDVVVAVVDTGADLSHPDLAANAWVNPGEVAGNGVDDDRNGLVDDVNGWNFFSNNNRVFEDGFVDRHGTHVSGTIGAAGNNHLGVAGVAWRVKLMSVKFIGLMDGEIEGTTADAIKAINYVTALRNRGVNLRAINASWGDADRSNALRNAIAAAGQAGILFVTAAGNGGDDGRGDDVDQSPDYPSGWSKEVPSIISVAALDRNDRLPSYSNFGHETVDVAAPGGVCNCSNGIYSTLPGGGYGYAFGTSMSAPHVTGIAALLWSVEPALTPAQVKQRIVSTAQPVTSLASRVVSSGRASAFNALTNAIPQGTPPSIRFLTTDKKSVTIDGLGFPKGSTVIEVNGVALAGTKFDEAYKLANATYTRIKVKLGKPGLKTTFPAGIPVSVAVINTATGERSSTISFTRN
ncbi:MAG TPA: S8 family peptidase [Blastocatellia bacterium]|nr:S8 family peptidase [Blastocatellia bacterium]